MFVGDGDSVLLINIQLILHSSELLLEFVDVGHAHGVQQGHVLGTGKPQQGGKVIYLLSINICKEQRGTAWTGQVKISLMLHPFILPQ